MKETTAGDKAIAIGSDHAGYEYKNLVVDLLQAKGFVINDFGTYSTDSVDYPDFAHPVADAVQKGDAMRGILICGSANGVAISANKHPGIRAAIAWTEEIAQLARQHNDANILCLPARFISVTVAEAIVTMFLDTPFEGGRHQTRVAKIAVA